MAVQYNINKYIQGVNGFGLLPCDLIYSATLAASTEETITVPSVSGMGAMNATKAPRFVALFSFEKASDVWVAYNATAAVPVGGTFLATTSELNPSARVVKAGDVIHMITADANTDVSVSFYAISEA